MLGVVSLIDNFSVNSPSFSPAVNCKGYAFFPHVYVSLLYKGSPTMLYLYFFGSFKLELSHQTEAVFQNRKIKLLYIKYCKPIRYRAKVWKFGFLLFES